MNIEATKFYIRHFGQYPETEMQDHARRGMWTLNVETAPYGKIEDIDAMEDLGPTVGLAGYIGDIHHALRKLGKRIPPALDYPDELKGFLGRDVWKATLGEIRKLRTPLFVPKFVKPVEHKEFTGFVWEGTSECRRRVITHSDDLEVWLSTPVKMITEWRAFVLRDEVLGAFRYKGVWDRTPDRKTVLAATEKLKGRAPAAYCLDFAVLDNDRTVLVEMNDGYAFGHYGLHFTSYARMLSARWQELTS